MSISKIMAFADAYTKYTILGPTFEYRHRAAKSLVDAMYALPKGVEIRRSASASSDYCDVLRTLQSINRSGVALKSEAARHLEEALLELAVPLADSIIALNAEPDAASEVVS